MPIIIPSSKIYDIDNSKILDNAIKSIQTPILQCEEKQELGVLVSDKKYNTYYATNDFFESGISVNIQIASSSENKYSYEPSGAVNTKHSVSFAKIIPIYNEIEISFARNETYTNFIDNEVKLTYSRTIVKQERPATITFKYGDPILDMEFNNIFYASSFTLSNPIESIEIKNADLSNTISYRYNALEAKSTFEDETAQDVTLEYNESTKMYSAKIKSLVGLWTLTGGGSEVIANGFDKGYSFTGSGTMVEYRPKSVNISIFGNRYSINLTENILTVTQESDYLKEQISLSKNDFIQATYSENTRQQLEKVIKNYENGREIATILCSVGEYYDEYGNIAISTNPPIKMIFEQYDKVIPYRYNSQGVDVPISLSKNGEAKIFEVLSSNVFFDGAVWQKLILKETGDKLSIEEEPPAEDNPTLSGEHIFNELIVASEDLSYNVSFTANSTTFSQISVYVLNNGLNIIVKYDDYIVYDNYSSGWVLDAYRYITFDYEQGSSEEFLEWFTTNSDKEGFLFTINRRRYFVEYNTTWKDWINSKYNTDNYYIYDDLSISSSIFPSDVFVCNAFGFFVYADEIISSTEYYAISKNLGSL